MLKHIKLTILSSLFFVSAVAFSQTELEKQAYSAFREKQYESAIDLFSKLIQKDNKNAVLLKDLGICYSKTRDYAKAIACLEKAATINKKLADIYPPLALAYIKQGKIDDGVKAFEIYAKSPDASPAILAYSYRSLGDIFANQKLFEKAASAYERSGAAFMESSDYSDAAEVYGMLVQLVPTAHVYAMQGNAYAKAFDNTNAVLAYESAVKAKPDVVEYRLQLAQAYYTNREFDNAANEYLTLIERDPANEDVYKAKVATAYREEAKKLIGTKDFAGALEKYDLAQQNDLANESEYRECNGAVYVAMGDDAFLNGKFSDAEVSYTSAVKLRAKPEWLHKKGVAHIKLEEWSRAILALEKAVEKSGDAVAYRDLGNAYYGKAFEDKDEHSAEYFVKAIDVYKKAMELDIDYTEMYGWLGLAYVQLAKAYEAEVAAKKAEENFVDEKMVARLNFGIADLHRYNKAKKFAKQFYEKVVHNDKAQPNIKAYSYFYLGEKSKAYDILQNNLSGAIDEQADVASAYFSLAALYSKDKRIDDALYNMRKALENGFRDYKIIPVEMELLHLHDNPEFLALQKKYGFRVKYIPKHIREQQFLQLDPIKLDGLDEE